MSHDNVKGLFTAINFTIGRPFQENGYDATTPFNDPAGRYILKFVASKLVDTDWKVSIAKRGHGCDATLRLSNGLLRLLATIFVERTDSELKCFIKLRQRRMWVRRELLDKGDKFAWIKIHQLMIGWLQNEFEIPAYGEIGWELNDSLAFNEV